MANEREMAAATSAHARALENLWPAAEELAASIPRAEIAAACERELFRPAEDEALMAFFGRFLSVREALWEVALDAAGLLGIDLAMIREPEERRLFLAGYAATCLIVQLDRLLSTGASRARNSPTSSNRSRTRPRRSPCCWRCAGCAATATS